MKSSIIPSSQVSLPPALPALLEKLAEISIESIPDFLVVRESSTYKLFTHKDLPQTYTKVVSSIPIKSSIFILRDN